MGRGAWRIGRTRRAGRGTAAAALAIGGLTPAQTAALQAAVEAGETGVNADAGPGLPFPLPPTALAAPVELLADTAARLAPGTLKRAAFDCAFAAGPKGAAAADIVAAVQAAGVRRRDGERERGTQERQGVCGLR